MSVAERTRAAYHTSGFVSLGRVLDPADVRACQLALEAWAARSGPPGPHGILKNNLRCELETVARLVHTGQWGTLACELAELTSVTLFQDNLVWKSPGARRIEWHQDYSYWPLDSPVGVTMWLALDDADVHNGCLHYIPGTHRLGECAPTDFIAGAGQPGRPGLPPLAWREREGDAIAHPVAAGDLVAHHPLVWHMSPANDSNRPRRALSVTWIGPDVRWDPRHAPHPFTLALDPVLGARVNGPTFPRFQ